MFPAYMYNDGTIYQTLLSNHQLDTTGGYCTLAKFEPSFWGEAIEFTAETALGAGAGRAVATAVFRSAKYLRDIQKAEKGIQWGTKSGMFVGMGTVAYKPIAQACQANDQSRKTKGISPRIENNEAISSAVANLPSNLNYKATSLAIDPSLVPSCKTPEEKNLVLKSEQQSCLATAIMNMAPLELALPVMVGTIIDK